MTKADTARAFHALHQGPDVLVLANAWDAVSARIVEAAGGKAIATSSAAVAWAHGYADGHDLPFALLVATTEEIARAIKVPLSVDAEAGYSAEPKDVEENVFALANAGAVGINLEDGREAPELHARKIEASRRGAERAGVDLFINARTDVYLKKLAAPQQAVEETIKRGRRAKDAGASGFFVPALAQPEEISAVVAGVALPLNVIRWAGLGNAAALRALGVRRLSAGGGIAQAALAATQAAASAFLADGDSEALGARIGPTVNYNELIKG